MPDETTPDAHTYVCAHCKKEGLGRYVAGGWWQFPLGWFVHDAADRWVCSVVCARSVLADDREEHRRRSGQRPKFEPATLPNARPRTGEGEEGSS